jgi:methylmalonyl-CoA/ethylmalonyl-CoA epimerase
MIYHLCYVTDDVDASLAAMARVGLEVLPIGQPKPACLFGGLLVSFHSIDQFGLIELIHGEPPSPGV